MAGPNPFKGNTPRTSLGLSGLGAVGGPRGTAAGGLRVLVEFVTQYDGEQVKKLEDTVVSLQQLQQQSNAKVQGYLKQQATLEDKINTAQKNRKLLTKDQQDLLTKTQVQYAKIVKWEQDWNRVSTQKKPALLAVSQQLVQQGAITQAEGEEMIKQLDYKRQLLQLEKDLTVAKEASASATEQEVAAQEELTALQNIKSQVVPKLGALALGAVGGIFGGALLGIGFEAAQGLIDAFTNKLRDILDPARHARDAVKELASAVESVGSAKGLSGIQAATAYIDSLGKLARVNTSGNQLDKAIALVTQTQKLNDLTDKLAQNQDQLAHGAQLYEEAIGKAVNTVVKATPEFIALQDQLRKFTGIDIVSTSDDDLRKLAQVYHISQDLVENYLTQRHTLADEAREWASINDNAEAAAAAASAYADAMERIINDQAGAVLDRQLQSIADASEQRINHINQLADNALAQLDRQTKGIIAGIETASDARVKNLQDKLDNLNTGPSRRTQNIQDRLGNLGSGESARTRALQAQIDRLNAAEERRAYLSSLADVAEDRYYLKLQHRLELTQHEINISDYHGKARVIAIEAASAALQKQQREQDRLNKLLDLQYQASQRITRNEGESVQDFLTRRAQEYRHQIAERQDLENQAKQDRLDDLKTEAEYRVALADNTEKRLKIIRDRQHKLYMDQLAARLQASRDADRAALEATRKSLQEQLQHSQETDRKILDHKRKRIRDEIQSEQEKKKALIDAANAVADVQRAAIEAERARQLANNEKITNDLKKNAEDQQKIILGFASATETQKQILAFKGAKTAAQLNLIAGKAIGSTSGYGWLKGAIESLGLDTEATKYMLANAAAQRAAYLGQLFGFDFLRPTTYAKGGIFPVTNSMNFGKNMRAGEGGTEIGVILSNKVAQALKGKNGGPLVGTMNIVAYEDPQRTAYRFKRAVKELQEQSL